MKVLISCAVTTQLICAFCFCIGKNLGSCYTANMIPTCTKTVKNTIMIVAVMNSLFSGTISSSSDRARQNAIPPRNPPKAIINWSMRVNLISRRRFRNHASIVTPKIDIPVSFEHLFLGCKKSVCSHRRYMKPLSKYF